MEKQYDIDDSLEEEIVEQRHTELKKGHTAIVSAINSLSNKEDAELKKLISDNRDAINKFVKISEKVTKQEAPQVKVETNQDKVVKAISDLGEVMKGIGDRLTAIESKEERPLATKLKAIYNHGLIDYVIIEYKK